MKGSNTGSKRPSAATPKNDMIKLWNQSTNELEPLSEQREIGRRFFGMGEDAFERSVFIGQIASIINTEKDKENEIIQKLQNLASSGDETQSYHLIESRLQQSIEKIRSKGGRIGILDRLITNRRAVGRYPCPGGHHRSRKGAGQNHVPGAPGQEDKRGKKPR